MSKSRHRINRKPGGNRLGKNSEVEKCRANRSDLLKYKAYVEEIVGDKARKVGWGQIIEGFEY
jgi:hypothetical protein